MTYTMLFGRYIEGIGYSGAETFSIWMTVEVLVLVEKPFQGRS
jgi:hypothetical protein